MKRAFFVVAAAGIVASGCVREIVPKAYEQWPTLLVARTIGSATLRWDSRQGERYTVYYAAEDSRRAEWRPLPGAQNLSGTGRPIEVKDSPPPGVERHYRLRVDRQ